MLNYLRVFTTVGDIDSDVEGRRSVKDGEGRRNKEDG